MGRTGRTPVMPHSPNRVLMPSPFSPNARCVPKARADYVLKASAHGPGSYNKRQPGAALPATITALPNELIAQVLTLSAESDVKFVHAATSCKLFHSHIAQVVATKDMVAPGWWSGNLAPMEPKLSSSAHKFLKDVTTTPVLKFDAAMIGHGNVHVVDQEDLARILDRSHGGWLNNQGIDAFLAWLTLDGPCKKTVTFVHDVNAVGMSFKDVVLPSDLSHYLRKDGAAEFAKSQHPMCSQESARRIGMCIRPLSVCPTPVHISYPH